RKMRISMRPRSDETLARYRQSLEQAGNCIGIGIGPAANGVHRALDRLVILAYRSMLPISITSLVLQPKFEEQRHIGETLQPRPPAIADKYWIGWETHRAEKERGPLRSGGKKRAAHVVRIVSISVIERADGYDCLEASRPTCRNLKRIQAAPRNSHHPDNAAAPGLRGQPRNHLQAIVLLLLCLLVEQQAIRVAATSDIDANARVAVAGQIRMSQRVPLVSPVALAVREILQDRRNRVRFGIVRQPDASGQPRAVFQWNQRVLDHAHSAWKRRHNHRGSAAFAMGKPL